MHNHRNRDNGNSSPCKFFNPLWNEKEKMTNKEMNNFATMYKDLYNNFRDMLHVNLWKT